MRKGSGAEDRYRGKIWILSCKITWLSDSDLRFLPFLLMFFLSFWCLISATFQYWGQLLRKCQVLSKRLSNRSSNTKLRKRFKTNRRTLWREVCSSSPFRIPQCFDSIWFACSKQGISNSYSTKFIRYNGYNSFWQSQYEDVDSVVDLFCKSKMKGLAKRQQLQVNYGGRVTDDKVAWSLPLSGWTIDQQLPGRSSHQCFPEALLQRGRGGLRDADAWNWKTIKETADMMFQAKLYYGYIQCFLFTWWNSDISNGFPCE